MSYRRGRAYHGFPRGVIVLKQACVMNRLVLANLEEYTTVRQWSHDSRLILIQVKVRDQKKLSII